MTEINKNRFKTPTLPMLMKLKIEIHIIENYISKIVPDFLTAN